MVDSVVEIEQLRAKYKAVVIKAVTYPSMTAAAQALGVTISTIRYKCTSLIHQDCYYIGSRRKQGSVGGNLLGVIRHRIL